MRGSVWMVIAAAAAAASGLACGGAWGDVRLPRVLSDGCVLQQGTEAAIFGFASAGEAVRVTSSWGAKAEGKAGKDGRFVVKLKTPTAAEAAGPQWFSVAWDGGETRVSDVLIGEVWVCGGQSNMEWPVSASNGAKEEIAGAKDGQIRLFTVENVMSLTPRSDNSGSWSAATPRSVEGFSAVGYAFAKELRRELGVPVGVISCDWGGTRAEAWMSEGALSEFPEMKDRLELVRMARDPNERGRVTERAQQAWWDGLDDRGPKVGAGWSGMEFDDSGWKVMGLPASLGPEGLDRFDGVVYYRVSVELPAEAAGKAGVLTLGAIDDRDDAWVNGVRVGSTREDGKWSVSRRYEVPTGVLRAGRNVVAVRMLDTAGLGGVNGKAEEMSLTPAGMKGVSLAREWKYLKGAAMGELPRIPEAPQMNPSATVTGLYNGMVATIAPMTPRGVLWYQGESNRDEHALYGRLFKGLIGDWRRAFGVEEMPFYFVQLAPFRYGGNTEWLARVREGQASALELPATGMVVTTDIGNVSDIHPRNKKEVGRRLSLWALSDTYGKKGVVKSGPMARKVSFAGGVARVEFDFVGSGLVARGGALTHWMVAARDGVFVPAEAVIEGETVVVKSALVKEPSAVRFGWSDIAEPNLFNKEGLPAWPFRTDQLADGVGKMNYSAAVPGYRGREPGFVDLFNGKDLSGWVNVNCGPTTWGVGKDDEGGAVITCTGKPTGVLRTEKMYENFVLEVEWRHLVAGGNAGLFVWSDGLTARGVPFTRSVEVQVMDGLEADWFTSDGDIFPIHGARMTPENGRGGDRAFPTERRMHPSPHWNHYRVECVDGTISLAVNGKVVTRGKNVSPRKGYICLESEGTPIEFRAIRIRELPGSGSLGEGMVASAADGWTALYNGENLAGWRVDGEIAKHWVPSDWVLRFDGKASHLWTERSYADFELIADWRLTGKPREVERPEIGPDGVEGKMVKVMDAGDSGIYLRGNEKSQVNIWCWPVGSGEVYGYRTNPEMPAEIRAGVTPRKKADRPIGEWNRFHVVMKGDRLTVRLNGELVIEEARLPGVASEGPIALQSHGDPIEFANVFIREIR